MAPTLYMLEPSPPVRSVLMVAAVLKVELQKKEVNLLLREHQTPEYFKKNPECTIPLFEDGDFRLSDSHAIMTYLANLAGKEHSIYPKDPKKRAIIDHKLYFDCGTLFKRLRNITRPMFFEGVTDIPQAKLNDILGAYAILEAFLDKNSWLAGEEITLADYSCITTLSALDVFVPVDKKKFPKLEAWMKKCHGLPEYKEKAAPGQIILRKMVEEKLGKK